jgi:hypothetical protein
VKALALFRWCRAARRRTRLAPPIAFHVAPATARAAIAAEGLDTVQRQEFPEIGARPEAVFLWGTLIDALYDARGVRELWAVSVAGLTLVPDPNDDWAWMVPHPIGAARLQWLGAPPHVAPQWAARRGWPEATLAGDALGARSHTDDLSVA